MLVCGLVFLLALYSAMLNRRFNNYENNKLLELIDILDKVDVTFKRDLKHRFYIEYDIDSETKNILLYFIKDFILNLIPIISIVTIIKNYNFPKRCYVFENTYYNNLLSTIEEKKRSLILNGLSDSCIEILDAIDTHMEILKKHDYFYTLAEDNYSLLMNVLENSFINGHLSEETIQITRQSFFDLEMFLSNLVKKSIESKTIEAEVSQKFINEYHSKFQNLIKGMSYDLKNKKAIF